MQTTPTITTTFPLNHVEHLLMTITVDTDTITTNNVLHLHIITVVIVFKGVSSKGTSNNNHMQSYFHVPTVTMDIKIWGK